VQNLLATAQPAYSSSIGNVYELFTADQAKISKSATQQTVVHKYTGCQTHSILLGSPEDY